MIETVKSALIDFYYELGPVSRGIGASSIVLLFFMLFPVTRMPGLLAFITVPAFFFSWMVDRGVLPREETLLTHEMHVVAVFAGVLAILFLMARQPGINRLYRMIPLLVFAYFVPTALSNFGIIPVDKNYALYDFIKDWLLPASLVLLILSVDLIGIIRLGVPAVVLFLTATAGVVIGGPIAYATLGWMIPDAMGPEAWKGLAALSGSWIGGGANFIAIGESVGLEESTQAAMVVVDVAVANVWMFFLLWFAANDKKMDEKMGANREALDAVRDKAESFQAEVSKPTSLADLLIIVALAFITTAFARHYAPILDGYFDARLPEGLASVFSSFTWIVLIVTAVSVFLSFTPVRRFEGVGASAVGSVFLYMLVASIGAKAKFSEVVKYPELLAVGGLWMLIHVGLLFLIRRLMKAPIFFLAVGSKANIGGAASAPIVAHAFHPALPPVGVLLAVGGYVVGTPAAIACAYLLRQVYERLYAGGGA